MKTRAKICKIKGCNCTSKARGMCSSHYMRFWRYGKADIPLKRAKNGEGFIRRGYKFFCYKGKEMPEHRAVMQLYLGRKLKKDEHIHHINGNKLDNRIKNLEIIDIKTHGSLHGKQGKGISKSNGKNKIN